MDRKEAIEILKEYRRYALREAITEALDLAIKALEREIEYGQMVVDFTKGETMKSDEWKYDTTCDAEEEEVDYCNNCPYLPWGKDCISRQDAVDVVHKYFVDAIDKTPHEIDEDGDDIYIDMKAVNELLKHNKHISKAIKALPPVTPTERTGEWIRRKDGGATCSRCGVMLGKGQWTNYDGIPDYYCCKCGAKMKGGTENE